MRNKQDVALGLMLAVGAVVAAVPGHAQPVDTGRIAAGSPNDWLTYRGAYNGWNYSGLDQINASTVKDLSVAWLHVPGRSTRGLQSVPLVADGVLYYTGSYSRVFALNGATGQVIWSYFPELDDMLVARQTHSPYNRGAALGQGKVFVGTVDGRLIALDMKTGKVAWDTKLQDSQKLTVGFTGAPLYAKGTVVIGSQGGEWPGRGPIYGVDAETGKVKWTFLTVAPTDEEKKSWGNDSWRTGGGGGWMPGTYNVERNLVYWGTANPAPLYDWAGDKWQTEGPRPGDNLYTSSVIALDPDTGQLKSYFQTWPHDAWDFDDAVGEFLQIEKDGQKYVVHPNKGGFVYVYDESLGFRNAWPISDNINFVQGIGKDGKPIGRRDLPEGKHTGLCPAINGGMSWNAGTYNPKTGLYYKVGNEWCMDLDVVKTTPITEPMNQLNIGANFTITNPPGGKAYGHVDARDPLTGEMKWRVDFPEPPLASLLSTGGNLLFVPDTRGILHAYDTRTGGELWSHNNGLGHNGGIISYNAKGKQYVTVAVGWGSLVGDGYGKLFGEPYVSMPADQGYLVTYALP
jgi:PQQ-dependent dehydrogenase (methanol/ethanol family)